MSLHAEHVGFAYRRGPPALYDVSLELRPGIVTGLFGPNGSGKSTLLRCCNGSLTPQVGRVTLDGQPLTALSRRTIARQIAVVPQDTPADVPLTVREVARLGRYAHRNPWDADPPGDAQIVDACLARLGLADLADRPFSQLSGGERQRAVIARALAQQGVALLLDEPNAHLDLSHQLAIYRLARAQAAAGQAVLMICHDLLLSPLMVDTAVVLSRGEIVAVGPARQVLDAALLERVFGTQATIAWDDGRRVCADFGVPPPPPEVRRQA